LLSREPLLRLLVASCVLLATTSAFADDRASTDGSSTVSSVDLVGVRAATALVPGRWTESDAPRRNVDTFGVSLFRLDLDGIERRHLSLRFTSEIVIAGGRIGDRATPDGALRAGVGIGWIQSEHGGVYLRGGARLDGGGHAGFARGEITFPRVDLGWQHRSPGWFFDVGADSGLALYNLYRIGDVGVDLGVQPVWGGHATVQTMRSGPFPPFRAELVAHRSEALGGERDASLLRGKGRLCTGEVLRTPFTTCLEGDVMRGMTAATVMGDEVITRRDFAWGGGIVIAWGTLSVR
jgi:hypothetical protein